MLPFPKIGVMITSLFLSFFAFADYDYSLLIGPTFNFYRLGAPLKESPKSYSSGVNYSAGALIGTQGETLGGEMGIFYVTRSLNTSYPGGSSNLMHSFLEIPIFFRVLFPFGQIMGGPYAGIPLSTSLAMDDLGVPLVVGASNPSIDLGMKAGIGFSVPIGVSLNLRALLLYSYGFTNLGQGSPSQSTRSLDTLAGLSVPLH